MKLLTVFFLMLWLSLSSSDPTLEECVPLVTPYPHFTPGHGRWNFIIGYINNPIFQVLFDDTVSQWVEFRPASSNPLQLFEDIGIKHISRNGYCKHASSPVTLHLNTAQTDKSCFTCTYTSLPTCRDCLLVMVNSRNTDNLLHLKNRPDNSTQSVPSYKALYLMSRGYKIPPSEIDRFKRQAECLGFGQTPSFHYKPGDPFCEYPIPSGAKHNNNNNCGSNTGSYTGSNNVNGHASNSYNFQTIYRGVDPGVQQGRNHDDDSRDNSEE